MSTRNQIKHFKGRVKDMLGIGNIPAGLTSTSSVAEGRSPDSAPGVGQASGLFISEPRSDEEGSSSRLVQPGDVVPIASPVDSHMLELLDTDHASCSPQASPFQGSREALAPIVAAPAFKIARPDANRPVVSTLASVEANKTRTNGAWKHFEGFRLVLDGITTGIEPLKVVMDGLAEIIEIYEEAGKAQSGYAALRMELEELFRTLCTHFSGDIPPTMTIGMKNLCTAIGNELKHITAREHQTTVRRFMGAEKNLNEVMECYRRIQCHLERLKLNADLSTWKIVDEQASDNRLKALAPSRSARYDSAEAIQVGRRECTPETRNHVLGELGRWRRDKKQKNMYWLNGMAGTGKTTIANTLCAILDRSHELAASFFCTRLLPDCRNVNIILPTIAYQLARFSRPFYHTLSLALQSDPDLHSKSLSKQLHGLVVEPLRKAAPALPEDLVIVIDALDECEDSQAVGILLEILANNASELPLKVFVSSRPEPHIREVIGDMESKLILHELEASIVKDDIKLYLQTELERLLLSITDTDLAALVGQAGVLFIYAATVVRYIGSATSSSRRQKRLREVLDINNPGASGVGSDIDNLYTTVLTSAFNNSKLNQKDKNDMKLVLDTVVCAQEPLTPETLTGLLALEDASAVQDALEPLLSVLHISGSNNLVTTLHVSFPDYMLDPTRSGQYVCQAEEHHGRLAELCFSRIDNNKDQFNICELESSHFFDEQVSDIDERTKRAIPSDLWYASRHWAIHLKLGGSLAERMQRVCKFISTRLLLWMEVLNLKKRMDLGAWILETARSWCEEGRASQDGKDLIHDAWRFVTMFAANDVSRSTAHLYVSMLISRLVQVGGSGMTRWKLAKLGAFSAGGPVCSIAFSPDGKRIVSSSYDPELRVWDAQTGDSLLEPLVGHASWASSVAYSPDGTRIVSGSSDRTIRVWDAQTRGLLLDPLLGHTGSVNSVIYSPDGTRIISGSDDSTVRVWDAQTGVQAFILHQGSPGTVWSVASSPNSEYIASGSDDCKIRVWDAQVGRLFLNPLEGHTGSVYSVAYSPDGMYIVSGSFDKTIRVWNANTGEPMLDPFEGHTALVTSVAFSPDNRCIVSSSYDHTIRVWEAQTGRLLHDPLTEDTTHFGSVAFSPSGTRIVSGSDDGIIRLWDVQPEKSSPGSLKGHTQSVESVAVSPDGTRIVSGSDDKTIQLWDARTGQSLLEVPGGHTNSVNSVTYSTDGTRIASGSVDKSVRVWDAQTGELVLEPFEGHTGWVNSVAFSPDVSHVVSGSSDNTIRVWNLHTGKLSLPPLKGHTWPVNSVAYSPDGTRIVSGSSDDTLRVWDAQTGDSLLEPFKGHTRSVNSVAYSPDGTHIVSGSDDNTIQVWDAQNGEMPLQPLEGHISSVTSVAYSPDGTRIVSASSDTTIWVWNAHTGEPLLYPVRGHSGPVQSAVFSPDGMHIISGSADKVIRSWNFQKLLDQCAFGIPSDPSNSHVWTIDERGWVTDQNERLLFWLPPDLRDRVLLPTMDYMISTEGYITLDFEHSKLGTSWEECYTPFPRI